MTDEVKELQNRAVTELVEKTFDNRSKDDLYFKAPTGSGKSYMIADYMNRILSQHREVIFLVSTLSKGNLAEQLNSQFLQYKQSGKFNLINPMPQPISTEKGSEERVFIPRDYNVYVLPRDLLKVTTDLIKDGAMERFLKEMTPSIFNQNGKTIILIKDECHIATNNLDKFKGYFRKTINFSATPDENHKNIEIDVEIKEDEAVNTHLIKDVVYDDSEDTEANFEKAIDFFIANKKDYTNKLEENPCFMVQISNEEDGEEEKEEIVRILKKKGLHYVAMYSTVDRDKKGEVKKDKNGKVKTKDVYETDDKMQSLSVDKWLKYVKMPLSNIDVIIFKLKISEGWDIPRACMLYQKRNTQSLQLDKQVIGRVRRNPKLMTFETLLEQGDTRAIELATTSWVWGIKPQEESVPVLLNPSNKDRIRNEIKVKTTRLKDLESVESFNLDEIINRATPDNKDIFTLYKNYDNSSHAIKVVGKGYTDDYQKWIKFSSRIADITKEYNKKICDYEESMILAKDENGNDLMSTVPTKSSFEVNEHNKAEVKNSFWVRADEKTTFSFDSEAEVKWVEILKELCSLSRPDKKEERIVKGINPITDVGYLWGKNYLTNSDIRYEYYLDGNHFSYPDFVMKDSYDNIHIFEVKSTNPSTTAQFDTEQYKEKINELKKCYKQASKITGNMFYIPIYKDDKWQIWRYKNGEEEMLTESMFKEKLLSNK